MFVCDCLPINLPIICQSVLLLSGIFKLSSKLFIKFSFAYFFMLFTRFRCFFFCNLIYLVLILMRTPFV